MIAGRVIVVDGWPLTRRQAEDLGIEIEILLHVGGDGGDVVETGDGGEGCGRGRNHK